MGGIADKIFETTKNASNGKFTFKKKLAAGEKYTVSVGKNAQFICKFGNKHTSITGKVEEANIVIAVTCSMFFSIIKITSFIVHFSILKRCRNSIVFCNLLTIPLNVFAHLHCTPSKNFIIYNVFLSSATCVRYMHKNPTLQHILLQLCKYIHFMQINA